MPIVRITFAILLLLFAAAWTYFLVASRNRPRYLWLVGDQPSHGLCFFHGGVSNVVGTALDAATVTVPLGSADGALGAPPTPVPATQTSFTSEWHRKPMLPRMTLFPGQHAFITVGARSGNPPLAPLRIEFQRWRSATPFVVPIVAAAVGTPLIVVPIWKRMRRRVPGVCRSCGYDLRATPTRCPECGTVPPNAQSPIP